LKQNAATGIVFQRFDASDGATISDDEAVKTNLIRRGTRWRTKATVGVALSHRRLWEATVADDRPRLVFEDDVFIREDFAAVFPSAIATIGAWDIVLFSYNTDALVEFNAAGDFDISALFTVKHPTAAQLT